MNPIRKFENLHIVMWLLKDTCWVLLYRPLGMIMIIPTLSLAFYITWLAKADKAELYHNLAVCCWICANSVWMTGEFFYQDNWRFAASIFFFAGLFFVSWYYIGNYVTRKKLTAK